MKKILDLITGEVTQAFVDCGYDAKYGKGHYPIDRIFVNISATERWRRQKEYKKAPFMIADEVAEKLSGNAMFSMVESVKPEFLNLKLDEAYLADYVAKMQADEGRYGCEKTKEPKTTGRSITAGPNVAKLLSRRTSALGDHRREHQAHRTSCAGHTVIGDVHLGDWGLQMGLIITELRERKPDLVYFDENYTGEYPEEAPFTISELEEIYPTASGKSKEDAAYKEAAMQATYELQHGRRGYQALLSHILNVSVTDLKRNYKHLNVSFDLWKGESDAQPYIPDMVQKMKDDGFAYISDGALVVDVKEDTDTKEIPPCMILKSDGASLYNTTDLATIVWRMKDYHPDELIYVVDKRQELYFTQVFRCARKTGLVKPETGLKFLGFGTMNGKDGKPFKTREGGVMRLQYLLESVNEEMLKKITENQKAKENLEISEEEAKETAKMIALAAIKYGDLSNQASKDYIFDIDRFTSFEGKYGTIHPLHHRSYQVDSEQVSQHGEG